MNANQTNAVKELRRIVAHDFPGQLEQLLVFGSVARGTDTAVSDIDIMVVLNHSDTSLRWQFEKRLRDIAFPLELEYDVVFDLKLFFSKELGGKKGHTPFMENVFGEGVAV